MSKKDYFQSAFITSISIADSKKEATVASRQGSGKDMSVFFTKLNKNTGEITIVDAVRSRGAKLHLSDMLFQHYEKARETFHEFPLINKVRAEDIYEPSTKQMIEKYGNGIFRSGSHAFQDFQKTALVKAMQYFCNDHKDIFVGRHLDQIEVSEDEIVASFR